MKKWILCVVLFVSGCRNGYTLSRNHVSDHIKLLIVSDEINEKLIQDFNYENVDIQKVICDFSCKDKIKEAENDYFDGIVLNGQKSINSWGKFENINKIPSIEIQKEEELDALKRIYPQYKWMTTKDKDKQLKDNAYYYLESEQANEEKIFFQKNNLKSICQLIEDQNQLYIEMKKAVNELLQGKEKTVITVKWLNNKNV